jgi:hypothetical protein
LSGFVIGRDQPKTLAPAPGLAARRASKGNRPSRPGCRLPTSSPCPISRSLDRQPARGCQADDQMPGIATAIPRICSPNLFTEFGTQPNSKPDAADRPPAIRNRTSRAALSTATRAPPTTAS